MNPQFEIISDVNLLREQSFDRQARESLLIDLANREGWQLAYLHQAKSHEKRNLVAFIISSLSVSGACLSLAIEWGSKALDPARLADTQYWQSMPFLRTFLAIVAAAIGFYSGIRVLYSYFFSPQVNIGKIQDIRYQTDRHQRRFAVLMVNHRPFLIPKEQANFFWPGWLVRIHTRQFTQQVIKVELEGNPPEYVPPHQSGLNH